MATTTKLKAILRRQPPMRKVVWATVPCICGGVYFFGWQALASVMVCCVAGFLTEWFFCRKRGEAVTEAVFVTGVLYALVMPANVEWHVLVVGMVFAVMFSKEVFGGFGRNFFNPALAGRCFVYICFPVTMTGRWAASAPLQGFGGLTQWSTATVDTISSATPMAMMKAGVSVPAVSELLFGGISGTMGVTSAILILIGGAYLFYTKTASRAIILSVVISYAVINQVLTWIGVAGFNGAAVAVLGGGFLFGAFFMATDPVSAAKTKQGRVIFGIIIAVCTVVIRNFSIFNGGMMFSILIANMFAPIIDYAVTSFTQSRKKAVGVEGVS